MNSQPDPSVDFYLAAQSNETRAALNLLRELAGAAHPDLVERIKWNAPSFAIGDEDRITLGVERKGGVRVVLHRGAKSKPDDNFHFDDVDGLAKWPSSDRGVIQFADASAIEGQREPLRSLFSRWIEATT
ncbi:DUF1801 domain-containing protein [uncultured Parasphingopyxis sp.]|uniref:DUF1801 domain-containing protein n=1 Tax=uncultured Parasphingopyxis sp. TaxID=1547918 RepID=UPI0026334CC7|nr:DUF1801 domain-containing protein [uncultured Parasphingopyxis sp.]